MTPVVLAVIDVVRSRQQEARRLCTESVLRLMHVTRCVRSQTVDRWPAGVRANARLALTRPRPRPRLRCRSGFETAPVFWGSLSFAFGCVCEPHVHSTRSPRRLLLSFHSLGERPSHNDQRHPNNGDRTQRVLLTRSSCLASSCFVMSGVRAGTTSMNAGPSDAMRMCSTQRIAVSWS